MTRAAAPRRTILKGSLDFISPESGVAISVPIFVYKKSEDLKKVEAHLYHRNDQGRIVYKKFCVDCTEELMVDDIIKMVESGDGLVEITQEDVGEAFNKTATSLRAYATVKLANISSGMLENRLMPKEVFSIRAFKMDTKKPALAGHESMLLNLLAALMQNKQALMVSACLDTVQRNCLLLPNGDLWTLAWEEEIREDVAWSHDPAKSIDNELVRGWKTFLKTREVEVESIDSAAEMIAEMETRISEKVAVEGEAVPTRKENATSVDAFNDKMRAALESMSKEKTTAKRK